MPSFRATSFVGSSFVEEYMYTVCYCWSWAIFYIFAELLGMMMFTVHYTLLSYGAAETFGIIQVAAYNTEGKSNPSPVSEFTTAPDRPGCPCKPSVKGKQHPTSFRMTWGEFSFETLALNLHDDGVFSLAACTLSSHRSPQRHWWLRCDWVCGGAVWRSEW